MTMRLTKAVFLVLVFSLIFFLLSNLVLYLVSTREAFIAGKLILVFGVYAEYIVGPESSTHDERELFLIFRNFILVGGLVVVIINVIVKALIRRWRPLKTLISFYIPRCLILSPLLMSWWIVGYVTVTSVFYSLMVFVYTFLAMIFAKNTFGRPAKINASETGECVCVVLVS